MNYVCDHVGFSEEQNEELTERAMTYITTGPFPLDSKRFSEE